MNRKNIMVVAGDPSGDANAADLVKALARAVPESQFEITDEVQPLTTPLAPRFFGAGGPQMASAGVELAFDLTEDSVIGPGGLLKKLPAIRRRFHKLLALAIERRPELIILVDYGGFNLRFTHAIREYVRARANSFFNWQPKIVQFISPQVWASRPGRANRMARDYDLILSVIPFEREWFAKHVPQLRVEFVGYPMFDKYAARAATRTSNVDTTRPPIIVLLPGSRADELRRHLPPMLGAARLIAAKMQARFKMVVPNETLAAVARSFPIAGLPDVEIQTGELDKALSQSSIAITKTGTITMECAYFGVPAVAIYKTSWSTYLIGRQVVSVKYLSMPNLLADKALFPEFIQGRATAENIAASALELLGDTKRRDDVRAKLAGVVRSLGEPGAAHRAALAIIRLMGPNWSQAIRGAL